MGKIYITSDLHFSHDREFLYGPRGFASIQEHDKAVITQWNGVIQEDDDVYVLGDLMLNDNNHGVECIKRLNGTIHIIYGNHDTDARKKLYETLNIEIHRWAEVIKYRKYNFYLSHFPTMTGNLEAENLHQCLINLYGHTHQMSKFYQDMPYMFHVGVDSNNNRPILLDDAIELMKEETAKCLAMLQAEQDTKCTKCVYEVGCATRGLFKEFPCPSYKRDAPDGGYYG